MTTPPVEDSALHLSVRFGSAGEGELPALQAGGERVFCRGWTLDAEASRAVLAVRPLGAAR